MNETNFKNTPATTGHTLVLQRTSSSWYTRVSEHLVIITSVSPKGLISVAPVSVYERMNAANKALEQAEEQKADEVTLKAAEAAAAARAGDYLAHISTYNADGSGRGNERGRSWLSHDLVGYHARYNEVAHRRAASGHLGKARDALTDVVMRVMEYDYSVIEGSIKEAEKHLAEARQALAHAQSSGAFSAASITAEGVK